MIITEEHVDLTVAHFTERKSLNPVPSEFTNWFFWMLIRNHCDDFFYKDVNWLLFQTESDVISDLSKQNIEGTMAVMTKHGIPSDIALMAQTQMLLIMSLLGPIYYASNKKLPMVKGSDLDKNLEIVPLQMNELENIFESFFDYNPYWYASMSQIIPIINNRGARNGAWVIAKTFIAALPSALEINPQYRE